MISINYRDPRPIYEQIVEGLRKLVLAGALEPDDKLPSVRELAGQLAINPNTIQRAYRELEQQGVIYTVAGKGAFVAQTDDVLSQQVARLEEALRSAVRELRDLGVPEEKILALASGATDDTAGTAAASSATTAAAPGSTTPTAAEPGDAAAEGETGKEVTR